MVPAIQRTQLVHEASQSIPLLAQWQLRVLQPNADLGLLIRAHAVGWGPNIDLGTGEVLRKDLPTGSHEAVIAIRLFYGPQAIVTITGQYRAPSGNNDAECVRYGPQSLDIEWTPKDLPSVKISGALALRTGEIAYRKDRANSWSDIASLNSAVGASGRSSVVDKR